MNIIKELKLADFVTIGNFSSGMLAIFFAINQNFVLSAILALAAVMCDFFDGKIARATKKANELGKQLDSFSDLISFGIWPAIFGYMQGLQSPLAIIVLIVFSLAGMLRLTRFNITSSKDFEGIPITVNGVLFPLIYFGFTILNIGFNDYLLIVYVLMSYLMLSTIRIGKI